LFVALIVMVAMALAAIALVRSVDTANLVAGNQAFKQSALNATDLGMAAAMARFDASVVGAALNTESATHADTAASCYQSTTFRPNQLDVRGIPKLLLDPAAVQSPFTAAFDTTYTAANNCQFANANGEIVRYVIDRQCDAATSGSAPANATCNVVSTSTPARSDADLHTGSESVPLYRVTVRVDGPRNSVSYAQLVFRP
ncbi:MAG: hypothetical protein ABI478_14125, partial [Propionivibrio sp.]